MKKTLLLTLTLFLLLGCETGVKNKAVINDDGLSSGIVNRENGANAYTSSQQKAGHISVQKIFSTSAQPGFYLQMAIFEKYRPTKAFLKPLDHSKFNYIVLNKYNKDYVLIGAYKSYNEAKHQIKAVKSALGKETFVVQVLRP